MDHKVFENCRMRSPLQFSKTLWSMDMDKDKDLRSEDMDKDLRSEDKDKDL